MLNSLISLISMENLSLAEIAMGLFIAVQNLFLGIKALVGKLRK